MKKLLLILASVFALTSVVHAATVFQVIQGGTGATSFGVGLCLKGNGTSPITAGACTSGGAGSGTVATSTPLVSGQVDFSTGVNTIGNDATFLFDSIGKLLTAQNFLATSSSTLQNFTFINATGTSATTTSIFSTVASSTNLFSSIGNLGLLNFQSKPSQAYSAGQLYYDSSNNSLTFNNGDSNVSLQIGQEEWTQVRNISGSSIANGSVVYFSGADAGFPTIALAQANAAATTIGAGMTTEAIANNATGFITTLGVVHGLNTSGFSTGATVFISATTPGGLVSTAPVAPNYRYRVGIVGVSSATVGTVSVTPSTAALGNGSANQLFGMNTAGTAQEVKSLVAGAGISVTPGTNTLTVAAIGGVSTSTATTTVFIDQNFTGTSNGTIEAPYKTITSAVKSYTATYWVGPGTYQEANCNPLNVTATSTWEFNQAVVLCWSGTPGASGAGQINFGAGAIVKDGVFALGHVSATDASLSDPATFQNNYLGGGNLTLSGFSTVQGGQLIGGEIYTKPGSLTAFAFVENNDITGVAGIANFDTMDTNVSAVGAGKYAITASTSGSVLQINGMSLENTAANGGGIYCNNGATATQPNAFASLSGAVGTTTNSGAANCGSAAIEAGPYSFISTTNGQSLYVQATNPFPFDFLGIDTEGTSTLAKFGGSVGVGTTTPQWTLQAVNNTGKAQFTLSDARVLTNNHWSFFNSGGVYFAATSSPATFASSSASALMIDANGFPTWSSLRGVGCAQFDANGKETNTGVACGTGGGGTNTDKFATGTPATAIYPNSADRFFVGLTSGGTARVEIQGSTTAATDQSLLVWNSNGATGPILSALNSQKVGVATATPFSNLTVATSSVANAAFPIGLAIGPRGLTSGSANGTIIGVNTDVFTGNLIELQNNGTSEFKVDSAGAVTAATSYTSGASSNYIFSGRSRLGSSADGLLELQNNAGTAFTQLNFGGATSAFPAFARVNQAFVVRLGDQTNGGYFAVGTSTPQFLTELSSSTAPQLVLDNTFGITDGKHLIQDWTGSQFRIGTSSDSTFTSTSTALILDTQQPPSIVVGTTTSAAVVSVGTANYQSAIASSTALAFFGYLGSSTPSFMIESANNNGTVLVATTTNAVNKLAAFATGGKVYMSGLTTSGSSQTGYLCYDGNGQVIQDTAVCLVSALKFKKDINPLALGLNAVLAMKPVTYYLKEPFGKEDAGEQIGFVADWSEEVVPDLVTHDSNGDVHAFNYQQYTAVLTKAIQELNAKVGETTKSAEDKWQDIALVLFGLYVIYNEINKRRTQ